MEKETEMEKETTEREKRGNALFVYDEFRIYLLKKSTLVSSSSSVSLPISPHLSSLSLLLLDRSLVRIRGGEAFIFFYNKGRERSTSALPLCLNSFLSLSHLLFVLEKKLASLQNTLQSQNKEPQTQSKETLMAQSLW